MATMNAPDVMPPSSPTPAKRGRPAPVTILAGMQAIGAIGYGVSLLLLTQGDVVSLISASQADLHPDQASLLSPVMLFPVIATLFIAALSSCVLLLRMRRLGWTITMLLTGFGLSTQIYLYWSGGDTVFIWLLINVLTVFYLNQRQVREAFGIGIASSEQDLESA
jgi:hypothetical protein